MTDTVPVTIQNWSDSTPPVVKYANKTTLKTWILDTTSVVGPIFVQISDFEPARCRLAIQVVDNPITLTTETPLGLATSTVAIAPQGRYLPANTAVEYEFFGADAFWIAIIGPGPLTTRVTVTKEYM